MATEQQIKFIHALHQMTDARKVAWKKTTGENEFQLSVSNYTVVARKLYRRSTSTWVYYLRVMNEEGDVVEDLVDATWNRTEIEGQLASTMIQEIYENARRIALGADSAMQDILEELRRKR